MIIQNEIYHILNGSIYNDGIGNLIEFYDQEPKAKGLLLKWYYETEARDWANLNEVRQAFNTVDYMGNVRFGNRYTEQR